MLQSFRGAFKQGTGLGLAIVYRIVSDYGGEIQVTSAPSVGTTVRVRLPAWTAVPPAQSELSTSGLLAAGRLALEFEDVE